MPYTIATVLLLAFVVNVVIGAVGQAPIVSIVWEMLFLLGASIAFSVGILRSEAQEKSKDKPTD